MRVTVFYMERCPATPATIDVIREVADGLRMPLMLERVLIETADQAVQSRFLGSPTVQVDGQDIEPEARAALDFGLT